MSAYDRVAYSDKRPITSTSSDGNDYSDDPYGKPERHSNGNGVYNDSTVEIKPNTYNTTLTFLCCTCKNTKRAKFIMIASMLVVVLSIILIIVSAIAHKKNGNGSGNVDTRKYGLFVYGPDDKGRIDYGFQNTDSYMSVFNRLEDHLNEYSVSIQYSQPQKYKKCEDLRSKLFIPPKNEVCMQTIEQFGNQCQNENMYGIIEGRPCVVFVLKLKEGFVPQLYDDKDPKYVELVKKLQGRGDNMSVPITCEGKTDADKEALQMHLVNSSGNAGSLNNAAGQAIDFNPSRGYPLYYFRQPERNPDYINPAVMVQFNTVPTNKDVTIQCTAWAKDFEPQGDFTVEFTFRIHS